MTEVEQLSTGEVAKTVKAGPVLAESCKRVATCRIHLLHGGQLIDAVFHSVVDNRIVLHVAGCGHEGLQPDALCCVAFASQQSLYAFIACVHRLRIVDANLEVLFDLPATLTATNLRRYYRVPMTADAPPELKIAMSDGTQLAGEVLNMSEAGLEMTLFDDDDLDIDSNIRCVVSFRGDSIDVPAIVRRRQQRRLALQFLVAPTPDARPTLLALQRMVRSLEQAWLRSRLVY